jgi:hypothetical protein
MRKSLYFFMDSYFGVPETISSDRGLQFTSSLWFKLCEMLNISHRKTTAYHPESNGAVERLHCCLKDALRARAAVATWSEGYPLCSSDSGLRAQQREDTGLSPAEAVFGAPIVLPNKFLQNEEISVDSIITNFSTTLDVLLFRCLGTILAPSCPASCQPSSSLPPSSGSVVAASSHLSSHSMTAPTPFCAVDPAPLPSESGPGMRSSPSATSRPARQWTPSLASRVAAADRRGLELRRPCRNQAGLFFRPAGLYTFFVGAARRQSRNRFPFR